VIVIAENELTAAGVQSSVLGLHRIVTACNRMIVDGDV